MGFLIAARAFLRTPLGRGLMTVLAVLLILVAVNRCGYHDGLKAQAARDAKAQAAAHAQVLAQAAAQAERAKAMSAKLADALSAQTVRTETLIKKVPYYVTRKADAACVVPTGFVRLWNNGAGGPGATASAPGGPLEAPSGIPLSAVAAADLANYGVAYGWREEALTWRSWYTDLITHWGDKR